MRIYEFIDKFCQDLIQQQKSLKKLIDLEEFPHDDVIEDDEGNKIPVVIVDGYCIPVADFLTLDKTDFLVVHKTQGCEEAFDNYLSAMEILEGEEALSKIRSIILSEAKRLENDVELITSI